MAKNGTKPRKNRRVSPLKPGLRGASRLVQSRVHAGLRSATLSRASLFRSSLSILIVFLGLIVLALWLGGHLTTVKNNMTEFKRSQLMAMGFTVARIDVTGEGRLNETDVRAAVGIYEGDYFFGADLKRAQMNTESLPWVDRAVVRRLWPNRIVVQLIETAPYAFYQDEGSLYLTNIEGEVIAPYNPEAGDLPVNLKLFVGPDAAHHAAEINNILERHPQVWNQTVALTRHRSGRWDVGLSDGRQIRLPLMDLDLALRRFSAIDQKVSADRFAIIDLRLQDRLTLTPAIPAKA